MNTHPRRVTAAAAAVSMLLTGCAATTDDTDEVAAEQVVELEGQVAELEGQIADLTGQLGALTRERDALAAAAEPEPEPEPEPIATGLAMHGDLKVKWDYGRDFRDLADRHDNCTEIGAYYTVEIQNRDGDTLGQATLDDGWLGREDLSTMVWINCEFVWSAFIEPGDLDEYAVVTIDKDGNAIDRTIRSASMLTAGNAYTRVSKRWH